MIGETLEFVDVNEQENQILLTTKSGRRILIHHDQDCCESVRIVDTQGNWQDLIGKVIVEVEEDVIQSGDYGDSETKTNLTFKVDGATVISRWIGKSNGCYSESVDIADVTKSMKRTMNTESGNQ